MDDSVSVIERDAPASAARVRPVSCTTGLPRDAFMCRRVKPAVDPWKRAFGRGIPAISRLHDDWDGMDAKGSHPR